MKLFIASDLHGSAYYTQKMIERYKEGSFDKCLLLGDLLYHGPRNDLPKDYAPKQVITMLNELKNEIIAVRGNCDAEVDQMVLDFPIMADYTMIVMENYTLCASHGHVYNPEHLPPLKAGDVFLYGHIHVPVMKQENGIHLLNPGSISLPKEGSSHSYMTLIDHFVTLYDLDGACLATYAIKPE